MTSSRSKHAVPNTATIEDIAKLWATLTGEYIPGLKIELHPMQRERSSPWILAQVCDYAYSLGNVEMQRSIWAEMEFHSEIYLISHRQLFDLLIVAYRAIDKFFATGEDTRPSR